MSARDASITETKVEKIEPLYKDSQDPDMARAEIWTVWSKSMQRKVRVEVFRAPNGLRAPMVYYLAGVQSEIPSGWSGAVGFMNPAMRAREVTIVAPTGAPSSMWSDWNKDDPILGPNKWETFLTNELPPLVSGAVPNNGHWGVLGVSMGAGAALHLAEANPTMFDAAGGVSGCYSTSNEVGYQNTRLSVQAGGGDLQNLWGPRGSAQWAAHDTQAHPGSLKGKRIYLSSATGLIGAQDLRYFGDNGSLLAEGHFLEKGTDECTQSFVRALKAAGIEPKVDIASTGIHNWPVFLPRVADALNHMQPGLGPVLRSVAEPARGAGSPRFGS